MISDEEITRFDMRHGTGDANCFTQFDTFENLRKFAEDCYNLGRQHQRESDAALCRDAAEKYMERAENPRSRDAETVALASNAAASCLESAILNNKEQP